MTIQIVEPSPSRKVRVLMGLQFQANTLVFDQSGKKLLSTSPYENVSRLWDVEKKQQVRRIGEHRSRVLQAEFSTDGRWIVSGDPTEIKVWPVERYDPRRQLHATGCQGHQPGQAQSDVVLGHRWRQAGVRRSEQTNPGLGLRQTVDRLRGE